MLTADFFAGLCVGVLLGMLYVGQTIRAWQASNARILAAWEESNARWSVAWKRSNDELFSEWRAKREQRSGPNA